MLKLAQAINVLVSMGCIRARAHVRALKEEREDRVILVYGTVLYSPFPLYF